MKNYRSIFKVVTTFIFKPLCQVKKKLKNAVKQDARKYTTLKKAQLKLKEGGTPIFGPDLRTDLIIVVENQLTNERGHMVPRKSKLNQVVSHRAVGILEIQPRDDDLPLIKLSVKQSFEHGERVLQTARRF